MKCTLTFQLGGLKISSGTSTTKSTFAPPSLTVKITQQKKGNKIMTKRDEIEIMKISWCQRNCVKATRKKKESARVRRRDENKDSKRRSIIYYGTHKKPFLLPTLSIILFNIEKKGNEYEKVQQPIP
ncbi:CLUMA_CG018330, isoform A [Clunio marinus]|uniref:CLUMA_CG018330, isoform A n=1 Tax=Clunio marinus TaxID=568069 RepID=A0A1J1J1N9_9DIPT|nr:CLUMA_CG018330, isoform A [Clunio marinus]